MFCLREGGILVLSLLDSVGHVLVWALPPWSALWISEQRTMLLLASHRAGKLSHGREWREAGRVHGRPRMGFRHEGRVPGV